MLQVSTESRRHELQAYTYMASKPHLYARAQATVRRNTEAHEACRAFNIGFCQRPFSSDMPRKSR